MNPLLNRPLPIAFGGPGAVTVRGPAHEQRRRYRRRRCTTTRTVTRQSTCSAACSSNASNGDEHCGQQYPPSVKSQNTSTRGKCE